MKAILDAHSEPGQRGLCRYVQAVFPGLNFRGAAFCSSSFGFGMDLKDASK